MSVRERARMEKAAGEPVTCGLGASCSMLTAARRCGVYEIRPMICRLWGVVEVMKCPYGCVPERYLTSQEGARLILEAEEIGGRASRERLLRELRVNEEFLKLAGEVLARTTQRPTLEGRDGALPRRVIDS
jgi:Fe-S-cluster containining protein